VSYYELLVIFSTNLTEEEEKTQASQIEELIQNEKGTIHLLDHWGKRKLAYPIKKQRQGVYEWYYFELDPARIAEIDRKLKMSETILRFLVFKMEKIQIQNLHREITRRNERAAVPQPEPEARTEETAASPAETAMESEPAESATQEEVTETAVEEKEPAQEG
jgi:small subunit ribosomal protein S6